MRGSSDILAAVDCHLALQRHKGGSYIEIRQTKNRYARESSPFKLRFTEKEGFNQFEFVGAIQSKSDRYEELKSTVLRVIEQSPLLTKKLLLEKVQAGKVDIKLKGLGNILDELMLDGLVRFQQGSRNAVHYYLAGDGESAPKTQ
jgi:hypothetical protein